MNRGDRRAKTEKVVAKRRKVSLRVHVPSTYWVGDPQPKLPASGRWRKSTPLDCGRPNCGICRESKREHDTRLKREIARRGADDLD